MERKRRFAQIFRLAIAVCLSLPGILPATQLPQRPANGNAKVPDFARWAGIIGDAFHAPSLEGNTSVALRETLTAIRELDLTQPAIQQNSSVLQNAVQFEAKNLLAKTRPFQSLARAVNGALKSEGGGASSDPDFLAAQKYEILYRSLYPFLTPGQQKRVKETVEGYRPLVFEKNRSKLEELMTAMAGALERLSVSGGQETTEVQVPTSRVSARKEPLGRLKPSRSENDDDARERRARQEILMLAATTPPRPSHVLLAEIRQEAARRDAQRGERGSFIFGMSILRHPIEIWTWVHIHFFQEMQHVSRKIRAAVRAGDIQPGTAGFWLRARREMRQDQARRYQIHSHFSGAGGGMPVERWRQFAAFSPDGEKVAIAQGAARLLIIDINGKEPDRVINIASPIKAVSFSADGRMLWVKTEVFGIQQWSLQGADQGVRIPASRPALFRGERYRISMGDDNQVELYDMEKSGVQGYKPQTYEIDMDEIDSIVIDPKKNYLLAGGLRLEARRFGRHYGDKSLVVVLMDAFSGKVIKEFLVGFDVADKVSIALDGEREMVWTSNRKVVRAWDIPTGRELWRYSKDGLHIQRIAYNPRTDTIWVGAGDGNVLVLNASTGRLIQKLYMHTQEKEYNDSTSKPFNPVSFIAVSPSGQVLTMDHRRNSCLWEPIAGQKAKRKE